MYIYILQTLVEDVDDVCSKVLSLENENSELEKENEALLETLKESKSDPKKVNNGDDEIVSMLKEKVSFVFVIASNQEVTLMQSEMFYLLEMFNT